MKEFLPKFTAAAVQASPIFLDRKATVEKACHLIKEAGRKGASLMVFPEAYIPTFPYWPRAIPHPERELSLDAYLKLYEQAVEVPSLEVDQLCTAAKEAGVYVIMGMTEREVGVSATMFNTLLFIDKNGGILGKHRKLVPTFEERCIWGQGDGSDLKVYPTEVGKLGGLICGNNLMTLVRYALLAKGEQIHAAVWPSLTRLKNYVDVVSRNYALEGQVFVIVSCGYMTEEMVPDSFPLKKRTQWEVDGGSGIVGPSGEYLAGPVYGKEEIIYADIDLREIIKSKAVHDVVGHYARPDVVSLLLREEPYSLIQAMRPKEKKEIE
ncbi:MAG: carbon-nitrogen hydrolase family protein [Pseudomonadota bacterium]